MSSKQSNMLLYVVRTISAGEQCERRACFRAEVEPKLRFVGMSAHAAPPKDADGSPEMLRTVH